MTILRTGPASGLFELRSSAPTCAMISFCWPFSTFRLLVARRVEGDELLRRRRDDLDGGVARVHQVPGRELEHVRRAADVHRLREHEAAEVGVVGGLAHDDARRVRLAGGRAGHEVLGRLVAEVREVEPARQRRRRVERGAGARHGRRQRRQRARPSARAGCLRSRARGAARRTRRAAGRRRSRRRARRDAATASAARERA